MLENVNLDQHLSKADYKERLPALRERLFQLQEAAFRARLPVAIVFEGWAASGKGTTIRAMAESLDPRGFRVVPVTPPRTHEMRYPWMRRFWLEVPARGQMVAFDTSWYRRVLIDRVSETIGKREVEAAFQDITDFEAQLAADGTLIVKFWLHISRKEQARRFKKLLGDKLTAWQVADEDAVQHKHYKRYRRAVEEVLARTEALHAPWTVVEATDRHFTRLKVIQTLLRALEFRLGDAAPAPHGEAEAHDA